MNKEEARVRIEKLRKEIDYHRYLYHVLDRQEISDAALDSLKKELFDLEQQYPDLITPDSPTQRVAGKPLKQFKKVSHEVPMLSLNDAFSEEDVSNWYKSIKKLLPANVEPDFYCEQKFDGLAISLIYENEIFTLGSTRGDGYVGEDVSQNLKTIESIPLRLFPYERVVKNLEKAGLEKLAKTLKPGDLKKIEVRGEVILTKKEFKRINEEQIKKGLAPYANPRNVASGSVRQLDPKITAARKLCFFAYDLISGIKTETHEEKHLVLEALGFKIHQHNRRVENLKGIFEFHKETEKNRQKLDYEIDGIVIIVNNNHYFDLLGVVGKAPRGALAYKFAPKEATTIVEDITVQVGRTGVLTPVAHLKPVSVGGVTISRSTLHNKEEIKRLGLKIGDTVIVSRAGDVIPQIVKVLPHLRTGKEKEFKMPKNCPVCGSPVKEEEGGIIVRCTNKNCFAQNRERLYHFVSKPAFDIVGLGPKNLDRFIEEKLIGDVSDIFTLKAGDIASLEHFGEKSADNIIRSIEKAKEIELGRFIYALSILHIGEEYSRIVAQKLLEKRKIKRPRDILKAADEITLEEWHSLYTFGPKVAQSLFQFFKDKHNRNLILKLDKVGIEIVEPAISHKLKGLTFAFTGTLKRFSREEAKQKVRALGGEALENVSQKTNYLVVGEAPGEKLEKAKKLKVKIINEEEFLKILES